MEWDPGKARANERRHGVRFSDVEQVFYDPFAITIEDLISVGERRFVTVGRDGFDRVLVVVYTYNRHVIRVISARKATRNERRVYEKGT